MHFDFLKIEICHSQLPHTHKPNNFSVKLPIYVANNTLIKCLSRNRVFYAIFLFLISTKLTQNNVPIFSTNRRSGFWGKFYGNVKGKVWHRMRGSFHLFFSFKITQNNVPMFRASRAMVF